MSAKRRRSEGAAALAAIVKRTSAARAAKKLGGSTSREAVRHWAMGTRIPTGSARSLLAATFGIEVECWDRAASTKQRSVAPQTSANVSSPVDNVEDTEGHLAALCVAAPAEVQVEIDRLAGAVREFISKHSLFGGDLFEAIMPALDPDEASEWRWPRTP